MERPRAAKDRRLGFDIKGDSGTLWFEASEKDWVQDFKVNGVSGPCLLEARLVDATGTNVVDPYRKRDGTGRPEASEHGDRGRPPS